MRVATAVCCTVPRMTAFASSDLCITVDSLTDWKQARSIAPLLHSAAMRSCASSTVSILHHCCGLATACRQDRRACTRRVDRDGKAHSSTGAGGCEYGSVLHNSRHSTQHAECLAPAQWMTLCMVGWCTQPRPHRNPSCQALSGCERRVHRLRSTVCPAVTAACGG